MEMLKILLKDVSIQDIVSIVTFFAMIIGGCFALYQWRKGLCQRRSETVHILIKTVRDNEDIASIMDVIDWDKGFSYDGNFHICKDISLNDLKNISDDELSKKIDKTLVHFSYICYLKKLNILTHKDMRHFDYEIRRLADNKHIANYLHTLYHWSTYLGVSMSFSFLLDYCVRKNYLLKEIKEIKTLNYHNYLEIPETYFEEQNNINMFNKILQSIIK